MQCRPVDQYCTGGVCYPFSVIPSADANRPEHAFDDGGSAKPAWTDEFMYFLT